MTDKQDNKNAEIEAAFIGLLNKHCDQEGTVKPLSNSFFDRIERLKTKAENDAETLLKAIILRIESKGNRSFYDANMLQELRFVIDLVAKNTPEMSKILDKKECETGVNNSFKQELSVDLVYQHLLQDRAEIAFLQDIDRKIKLLTENTEQITNLLLYKDEYAYYGNDIDY